MRFVILFSALLCMACATSVSHENQTESSEKQLESEGFTKMILVQSPTKDCEFVLANQDGKLFEIENISTQIKNQKIGNTIWLKYTPLRKMSVCEAQPISIDEIHLNNK